MMKANIDKNIYEIILSHPDITNKEFTKSISPIRIW